jgi:hypothetical protein
MNGSAAPPLIEAVQIWYAPFAVVPCTGTAYMLKLTVWEFPVLLLAGGFAPRAESARASLNVVVVLSAMHVPEHALK